MDKVKKQNYVTFVGVSGSGKSATARHIALKLKEEGYEVVPITEIREIKDYCDTQNPQVFVIDDVVGVHGLQKTKLDILEAYEKNISNPCMCLSITLMTCREVVFNEALFCEPFFTKKQNVIKLHDSENALDNNDRKLMLRKYGLDVDLLSPSSLAAVSRMFPLLCKLYSGGEKFRRFNLDFFISPITCIRRQFYEMQRRKELHYASLVLCMLNGGHISEDALEINENESFIDIKREVLKNCKVESNTDTFKFIGALSAMEGTYTKQSGTHYTFVHDSIFEILAYQYGQQFPQQILKCLNSTYIANCVKPKTNEVSNVRESEERMNASESEKCDEGNETEGSFDLCIRLSEDQYPQLAQRLYRDIEEMELYDVFMNDALKHPQVCQAFIEVLKGKSYIEVKSLFFDEIETIEFSGVFESLTKGKPYNQLLTPQQRKLWRSRHKASSLTLSKLLLSNKLRVISWVICFGHHGILQYLVKQTEDHQETNSVMFCENWWLQKLKSIWRLIVSLIWRSFEYQEEKKRLLLLCCLSGDVDTLKILLQYVSRDYINLAATPEGWSTPLIVACEEGHASIVRELISVGANVNLPDRYETPLTVACRHGHDNVVNELLKANADVNLENRFDTPLTVACRGGFSNVVEKLLKVEGVDVNSPDIEGNTPLVNALLMGFSTVLEKLLEYDIFCVKEVDIGVSALYAGFAMNNTEIVEGLLKSKQLKGKDGKRHLFNILVDIRKANVKTDCKDDVTETNRRVLLMESRGNWSKAILSEDSRVLRHLLNVGLDKNQLIQLYTDGLYESDLRPLLHVVIDEYYVNDRIEKIKILLEAGVNVNAKSKLKTIDPWFGTRKSRECNNMLDREGISALERTKRIINASAHDDFVLTRIKTPEYKKLMLVLKKRVRRHSASQ
ncbi:uncharacterized protein LOC134272322 [Saccostrea cucullata]|uniref:uncharacterized protein LOC134272322 n=1 Tax=Saccostrea cuccullata TaxID=36930 RepID=UPI002ED3CF76